MAFSGSSYFAGIGTVVAAIAFGVACGSMVTTSVVQPPNRLERVKGSATDQSKRDPAPPSTASSSSEQASTAKPVSQQAPPSPVVAAAPSVPAVDPQPALPPQPAAPAAVKVDAATSSQEQPPAAAKNSAPMPVKSDDASVTRNEGTVGRASDRDREASRSADPNRQASRKRKSSDDRKFSERRRRHDQDQRQLDEATNVAVQPMPRDRTVDEIVEPDDGPRFGIRPRRFEFFGDDDPPRRVNGPPPGLGFFGFGD